MSWWRRNQDFVLGFVLYAVLIAIAVGVNWTAYESHIANNGVGAMTAALNGQSMSPNDRQHQSDQWKQQQPKFGEQHGSEGYTF